MRMGPNVVMNGLLFYVDASNDKSYPGSGATVVDLINDNTTTASSSPTFNSNGYWEFDTPSDDFIFSTNPLHENSITSFTLSGVTALNFSISKSLPTFFEDSIKLLNPVSDISLSFITIL